MTQQQDILAALQDRQEHHISDIVKQTSLPLSSVYAVLQILKKKELVTSQKRGYYSLPNGKTAVPAKNLSIWRCNVCHGAFHREGKCPQCGSDKVHKEATHPVNPDDTHSYGPDERQRLGWDEDEKPPKDVAIVKDPDPIESKGLDVFARAFRTDIPVSRGHITLIVPDGISQADLQKAIQALQTLCKG